MGRKGERITNPGLLMAHHLNPSIQIDCPFCKRAVQWEFRVTRTPGVFALRLRCPHCSRQETQLVPHIMALKPLFGTKAVPGNEVLSEHEDGYWEPLEEFPS